jgi:hypothetical protein
VENVSSVEDPGIDIVFLVLSPRAWLLASYCPDTDNFAVQTYIQRDASLGRLSVDESCIEKELCISTDKYQLSCYLEIVDQYDFFNVHSHQSSYQNAKIITDTHIHPEDDNF